jgi:3'(2'), 5'-bisphosphate nucleotidase
MPQLARILADFDPDLAARVAAALPLMRRQAAGSLRLQKDAKAILKSDRSPVTIADLLHQSQFQHLIAERFAGDALVGEEPRALQAQVMEEAAAISRDLYDWPMRPELTDLPESARATWMLDPIDGTKGYLAGRCYAIALGLFIDGEPIFGAMAVPPTLARSDLSIGGRLAFAVRGRGAWIARLSAEGDLEFEPLRTPPRAPEGPIRVAVSLEHGGAVGERLARRNDIETVKLDSQAKYLAVATGDIDAYLRERRKDGATDVTWDHQPGATIAQEAGCRVRRFDGAPVRFEPTARLDYGEGVAAVRTGVETILEAVTRDRRPA